MFVEKLNKKQEGVYVIEEEKNIENGKWEGYLDHDNVNHESIVIYTGPKFTGKKVDNFFISTPSEMPWKTYLKIFSDSEKIYVTYESSGDQVEAEDINLVQQAIADNSNALEEYKDSNNIEVNSLKERTTTLENAKADITYVNTELLKKADKANTYTKEETDARIQAVIGAAPEALDTLQEIANSLNNDADFAGTIMAQLAGKVDKVSGKGLSTEDYTTEEKTKLAGIQEGANNYVHPSTHPAGMITGLATVATTGSYNDLSNKPVIPTKMSQLDNDSGFVTQSDLGNAGYGDMLKSIYDKDGDGVVDNAKSATTAAACTGNAASATKLATARTISLTGDVTGSVSFDGSANVSIVTTVADDSHCHVIGNIDGLQTALDGKASSTHNHDSLYVKRGATWNDLKGV